jgi:hypothetical protein
MDKLKGAKYFTYGRDTIIYRSKRKINGKPLSKPTRDFLSQQ